jgi:hypothetical protein
MNAAELKKWEYQTDTAIMLPYSERHVHVYPESFLAKVYFQLKDDGTLDKIFPGMGVLHLNRFLGYLPKCHGLVMCCLKNPDPTHQPRVGRIWLVNRNRYSPVPHSAQGVVRIWLFQGSFGALRTTSTCPGSCWLTGCVN